MLLPSTASKAARLVTAVALTVAACAGEAERPQSEKPRLGLMSSLPIVWAGNDAFAALAQDDAKGHWAMQALKRTHRVEALDMLSPESLAGLDLLLLAQPRALSPAENVALDDWVRGGGAVLVFADPKLVGEYDFALGDPRRPLDTVLLSPILARWGLELIHDQTGPAVRTVPMGGAQMAVAAAGRFRPVATEGAQCRLTLDELLARCRVGEGRAAVLADATLLEDPVGGSGSPRALAALLGMVRDKAGQEPGTMRE